MREIWKPIRGYEGLYEVSNLGNVRGLVRDWDNRTKAIRNMRQHVSKTGYLSLRLCKDGKTKLCKVHRLVAEAFLENPSSFPFVNHLDGNKLNNNVSNLEWCSASRNIQHAYDTGLKKTRHVLQINKDGEIIQVWDNMSKASESSGVGIPHIYQCCAGQRLTAGGYKWAYTE